MKNPIVKRVVKYFLLVFLGFNAIMILLSLFVNVNAKEKEPANVFPSALNLLNFDSSKSHDRFAISDIVTDNTQLVDKLVVDNEYGKEVLHWINNDYINVKLNVTKTSKYQIALDYESLQNDVQDISITLSVDGNQKDDLANIVLPSYWKSSATSMDEHIYDIYKNEVTPTQVPHKIWRNYFLYDQRFYNSTPISIELSKGEHVISIKKNNGELLLGDVYLVEEEALSSYSKPSSLTSNSEMIVLEGENPFIKTSSNISGTASQMTHLTPYSTSHNMINTLNGDTFNVSGQAITYAFDVKEAGYYKIALKYYISQTNTSVYSKILIDNQVLNEEMNRYCFRNLLNNRNGSYRNEVLNNGDDDIMVYFEPGTHTLSLQLDASLTAPIYYELLALIDEMNELYLEVVKLTGGNTDKNKTWNISKYIPTAETRLNDWKDRIANLLEYIEKYSKSDAKKQNRLYQQVNNAYDKIVQLCKNPNELPHKLNVLVDGSASASLMLSNSLHTSTFSPLSIDKIYIYGADAKLPKVKTNFFKNYLATSQRVFRTTIDHTDEDTITIWVNRSTFYVSLMQQFADAFYTKETGVKVRLSLLPDESKLTYANASNTQPDAAIGVSSSIPYTLGIRGALADLHQFEGFGSVISKLSPGAILPFTEGGKVYGLPETQDFQVTFYREDILNSLGIDVPQTYEDIIDIVPTLQRYGMNYYMPLAGGSGLKGLGVTAPFIYQYGGDIYSSDYMSVDIDSEESIKAFNMMVDLFALYSLPLTTQNFYNNFRSGLSPVGVAGFDTYLQLVNAAPEIVGKWKITLAPGVDDGNGNINRTQTGDSKTCVIFNKSKHQEEAWKFISWWLSTPIQTKFASDLQATYGATYLWNSANLEAFKTIAIAEDDKEIILKQLEYLYQIPQTPATYMVERGISNIWNSCVFDQVSLRAAITNYTLEINREIKRKMTEFKYLDSEGKVLKPYEVPTIEDIKKWMEE